MERRVNARRCRFAHAYRAGHLEIAMHKDSKHTPATKRVETPRADNAAKTVKHPVVIGPRGYEVDAAGKPI